MVLAPELQVRDGRRGHGYHVNEAWVSFAQSVEESLPVAREDRYDGDLHLVDQVGGEVPAGRSRATAESDVLAAGCLATLREC
jgi:hypothetical protein